MIVSLFSHASTVSTLQSNEGKAPTDKDQRIETIIVEGRDYNSALKAFNRGDFEVAEIEFKKNARCALRMERNKQAFVNGLQSSAISSNLQSVASLGGGGSAEGNSSNQTSAPASNIKSSVGGNAQKQQSKGEQIELTCENRAYQLYMMALSQLQLGRSDEAEKNLKTASFLNKDIYDAHYRLALMRLLRNDTDEAQERLEDMEDVLNRCRDCEAKPEILARIDFIKKALSGEIKLN